MDVFRELTVPAPVELVFSHVDDLAEYPAWMPLIGAVELVDDAPTWSVLLQAQVGPFTRSKRLRMVRKLLERADGGGSTCRAVFERHEIDGRDHAMWRLESSVEPTDDGRSVLCMHLHYDGRLWGGPVLERVLDAQIAEASDRLLSLVTHT